MRHSISRRFGAWGIGLNYNKQESKNGRLAAIFSLILQDIAENEAAEYNKSIGGNHKLDNSKFLYYHQ